MKRILTFLMLVSLCLGLTACGTNSPEPSAPTGTESSVMNEQSGFASAEDAVIAYISAVKDGDVKKALSTFAFEKMAVIDVEKYLERTRSFLPSYPAAVLSENVYERELVIESKRAEIARAMYLQYAIMSSYVDGNAQPLTFSDEDEVDAFLAACARSDYGNALAELKIGKTVPLPELLGKDILENESVQQTLDWVQEVYGADDIKMVAISLEIDGKEYIQFMNCICYDGEWYNAQLGGYGASLAGISTYNAGLILRAELIG